MSSSMRAQTVPCKPLSLAVVRRSCYKAVAFLRTIHEQAMSVTSVERLQKFRGNDLQDLCEAAEEGIKAGGGFGWLKPPPRSVMESYWRGVLLVPERMLFVGRLDGVIAGTAQLVRPPRNNEAQVLSAHITTHFVAPWARGHGLARAIVLAAEEAALAAGALVVDLDVRETQEAAIQLYQSLGYRHWGTHPRYARIGEHWITGLYLYKDLAAPLPEP
jgi:ribosomal protein S18 acetylase RimI-like enzyme